MPLARLSIRRPVAIAMFFLGVVLLGVISFSRLPIDLLPDVAYPRLVVHTTESGAAPAEVERFLSEPIEQAVSTVPGVREVTSVSRDGISLVTVEFAWGTDMDFAALNVRERLDGIGDRLPELASRPTVLRLDPRSEPVMALSVAGDAPLPQLKELADQVFRRRLEQIDGVARAATTGGLEREIQVEVNPRRLDAFGLSLDDVTAALAAANQSAPGGTVRQGRYRYSLRTIGELTSVDEISRIPLRSGGDTSGGSSGAGQAGTSTGSSAATLLLRDVAVVTDGFRERESIARYNGAESVGVLVFKDAGSNTVRVDASVRETLEQLRSQFPEVRIEVAMSQAEFVSDAIDNVVGNLIQGAALAFLVLLLFLRDWRFPLAIGVAIPISVIGAFVLLDAAGVSLNVMSLGGLALGVGMLVDNSIVVLENTFRHREMGKSPDLAAADAAEEVQGAITAATLTTIAVFGPIIYLQGVAGEMFGALSLAVAFSLLASLVVALTLLPAIASRWRGPAAAPAGAEDDTVPHRGEMDDEDAAPVRAGGPADRSPRGPVGRLATAFDARFARFADRYETTLHRALENRWRVIGVALGALGVTVVIGIGLDRRLLPVVDQGEFRAALQLPRGTPLEQTEREAVRLEQAFLADAAVEAVFTSVGRREAVAGADGEESGLHTALLEVRLREGESADAAVARLRPLIDRFPPGALSIERGEATAIGRLLGGSDADLAVRLRGEDLDAALAHARALEPELAAVPALMNVRLGTELGQPEIRVEIDRERAASYGIAPGRIADAIEGFMKGAIATEFVDFDRKIPVVVRLPETERRSLATLETLRVDGVPLRQLVRVEADLGPTEIRRESQGRVVAVHADIASGGLEAALEGVRGVLARNPPPAGIRAEVGGENEEMNRSFRELGFAFGLALLLVFMILAAEFESVVRPVVILLSVPMGAIGAVLALWISGAGLNTMSLIGIVILAGIVDNDAVVKISFIEQMRAKGLPLREAILAAGRARLRPILMTTLTTLLGVLPMALFGGRGAELRAPLAIAIFGGLFTATALTLIVLPVIYEAVEEARGRVLAALPWGEEAEAGRGEPAALPGD